jgi:hypothetical protein
MEKSELKTEFDRLAKGNGFEKFGGGWILETKDSLVALDLQNSNYGNYLDLNLKIFVKGLFGKDYVKSKDLVKKEIGNIFLRQPKEFGACLNLEEFFPSDEERKKRLYELFDKFILPVSQGCSTKQGILDLGKSGQFKILPAVYDELLKMPPRGSAPISRP